MIPKIVLHNSISLDGSLNNFEVNMELHYQISSKYKPDAHLIGSNTIKKGIELFGSGTQEDKNDFDKPERNLELPYWIIIDTKGILKGMLHEVRRYEFCKDVVLLISKKTPKDYITYLKERNYDFQIIGKDHVNLKKSLEFLFEEYNVKNMLTDCGRILSNLLLNHGFIYEISLLIHPVIVGNKSYSIFNNINNNIKLELLKNKLLDDGIIWLVYRIKYN